MCNTYCFSTTTVIAQMRLGATFYVHGLSLTIIEERWALKDSQVLFMWKDSRLLMITALVKFCCYNISLCVNCSVIYSALYLGIILPQSMPRPLSSTLFSI